MGQLLLHPVFVEGELLAILQQALHLWKSPWTSSSKQALTAGRGTPDAGAGASAANAFQQNEPIASVVNQILRVLYPFVLLYLLLFCFCFAFVLLLFCFACFCFAFVLLFLFFIFNIM